MERLDRLGWAAGIAFESYGLRIGVRTNTPNILPQLGSYFPPNWTPATDPEVDWLYSLKVGGEGARPGVRRFHLAYSDAALIERLDRDEQRQGGRRRCRWRRRPGARRAGRRDGGRRLNLHARG